RDEDLVGGAPCKLDDGLALLVRCGYVEEHDLVPALGVVAGSELHRIARIAQAEEVRPLHGPPGVDVEAGDDALQGHEPRVAATSGRSADRGPLHQRPELVALALGE